MAKTVKSLSGSQKDSYLARVVSAELGGRAGAADVVAQRLVGEVTRVWVKLDALGAETMAADEVAADQQSGDDFDPFTPNVVVVLRREGRAKALAALDGIREVEHLKRLAREQQLGIDPEIAAPEDIRLAIVTAAERRVANRRAAAS